MTDLYGLLQVPSDATEEAIQTAYKRRAKALHPDHGIGTQEEMAALNQARDVLVDPHRRSLYDQISVTSTKLSIEDEARLTLSNLMVNSDLAWDNFHDKLRSMIVKGMKEAKQRLAGLRQTEARWERILSQLPPGTLLEVAQRTARMRSQAIVETEQHIAIGREMLTILEDSPLCFRK